MTYLKGEKPEGCILCLIKEKSAQVSDLTVWENDNLIVSVNLYPYNPGHLMVFPRRHILDIRNFTEKEELQMERITKEMLNILDITHTPFAYNIGYNMGLVAGASIDHLHRHIIPRYPSEIGISELLAGKKVLVENPYSTCSILKSYIEQNPFSL